MLILGICLAAIVAVLVFVPRIAQNHSYHCFSDSRTVFGIANFFNVASNIPFGIVGLLGLISVLSSPKEDFAYATLFIGITLTALGSAYYHHKPSNAALVWDRLPMTLAFMSILAIVVSEYINTKLGQQLLLPFLIVGIGSIFYWKGTEARGKGDLRPYALVQFLPMIIIPFIVLLFPDTNMHRSYILKAGIWYVLAKVFEVLDSQIYNLGKLVSGHTLKHLTMAVSCWYFLKMAA